MSMHELEVFELDDRGKRKEVLVVDVERSLIKNFKIGQNVIMTVKGSIGMMQVPPQGLRAGEKADMGIRVTSKNIQGQNAFADLAMDEDEE